MMDICCCYDGTFYGFLTCVFDAYLYRETPIAFRPPEDPPTLWEERQIVSDPVKAQRVMKGLAAKVGPRAQVLVRHGFLCAMEEKELVLYRFIRFALGNGPRALQAIADSHVAPLLKAVQHLEHEAHLYTGFVRFSRQEGFLVSEIEPKNRVLPLLCGHFCSRLNTECFVIHDRTHSEALFHKPGRWAILPVENFRTAAPDEAERRIRALWRNFYSTVAIDGRINPRLQQTHLPLHFRARMTEFQPDTPSPGTDTSKKATYK